MGQAAPYTEKRKHKRYKMRDGTYALLRTSARKIGQLIDLSLSGLAFTYFSTNGAAPDSDGLDLLAAGNIHLQDIPYQTVSDFVLPNEQPFSQIIMRRRCIKFKALPPEIATSIEQIIQICSLPDEINGT